MTTIKLPVRVIEDLDRYDGSLSRNLFDADNRQVDLDTIAAVLNGGGRQNDNWRTLETGYQQEIKRLVQHIERQSVQLSAMRKALERARWFIDEAPFTPTTVLMLQEIDSALASTPTTKERE